MVPHQAPKPDRVPAGRLGGRQGFHGRRLDQKRKVLPGRGRRPEGCAQQRQKHQGRHSAGPLDGPVQYGCWGHGPNLPFPIPFLQWDWEIGGPFPAAAGRGKKEREGGAQRL